MRPAVPVSLVLLGLVACSARDPIADEVNNAAVADIDVLPPDESVATPTNELENGAVAENSAP